MPRKKVPLGKAIKLDAVLSAQDQAAIKAIWRRDAPPTLKALLDAKPQPRP